MLSTQNVAITFKLWFIHFCRVYLSCLYLACLLHLSLVSFLCKVLVQGSMMFKQLSLKHIFLDVNFSVQWSFLKKCNTTFFFLQIGICPIASSFCTWSTWRFDYFRSTLRNFDDILSLYFHLFGFVGKHLLCLHDFFCYFHFCNIWYLPILWHMLILRLLVNQYFTS